MQFEAKACRRCKVELPPPVVNLPPLDQQIFGPLTRVRTLRELEEMAIVDALQKSQNVEEAAKRLGIGRTTLYLKLQRYGIVTKDVSEHTVRTFTITNLPPIQGYLPL